jgi:hypothetical protein
MEFEIENYKLRATEKGTIERYYEYKTKPPIWKELKGNDNNSGYLQIGLSLTSGRRNVLVHRLVYYAYNPDFDIWDRSPNNVIDHRDRNRSNNKIGNLQQVTNQQNQFNREVKGYTFRKDTGKYKARIHLDRKVINLGEYDTPEEAHEAYLEGKEKYHIIP